MPTNKTKTQRIPAKVKMSDKKKNLITILCIILLLILFDVFVTGYVAYARAYMKCGRQPIVVSKTFFFSGGIPRGTYTIPGSDEYKVKAGNDYYCTRDQAEESGARPNVFTKEGAARQRELDAEHLKH